MTYFCVFYPSHLALHVQCCAVFEAYLCNVRVPRHVKILERSVFCERASTFAELAALIKQSFALEPLVLERTGKAIFIPMLPYAFC